MGKGFETGFFSSVGEGLNSFAKKKLELALETQQLKKTLALQQQFQSIPQDQLGGTLNFLQNGKLPETLPTHPTAQAGMIAGAKPLLGIQAKYAVPKTSRPQLRNVGNQVIEYRWDEHGNRTATPLGLNPQAYMKASGIIGDFAGADATLDQIEEFSNQFLASGTLAQSLPQGVKTRLSAVAQTDASAKAFLDFREKFALDLTAMVSGKQMTEHEREAILRALPGPEDSLETAKIKLNTYRDTYEDTKNRKVKAITQGLGLTDIGGKEPKKKTSQAAKDYVKGLGL